jgi:hypothetical protein
MTSVMAAATSLLFCQLIFEAFHRHGDQHQRCFSSFVQIMLLSTASRSNFLLISRSVSTPLAPEPRVPLSAHPSHPPRFIFGFGFLIPVFLEREPRLFPQTKIALLTHSARLSVQDTVALAVLRRHRVRPFLFLDMPSPLMSNC